MPNLFYKILLLTIFEIVLNLSPINSLNVKLEKRQNLNFRSELLLKQQQSQVKWFEQKIDHFSYTNNDTFQQRYIISTQYWKPNGPIWFYCGNEGDIFTFANNTGFMWENSQKFNAMVVFMEHRYYGESMPYGNQSKKSLGNLGYLTTEQALADYADFLAWIQWNMEGAQKSPVVVMGGSYGGMLAAWFRMKYPHLCVGALAASAPILQFPGIYNCEGYNQLATQDFSDYSPKCSQTIRQSWKVIRRLGRTPEGLQLISETFSLCNQLTEQSLETFVDWLADIWGTLPMIDYPNAADFLQPLPAYPIKHICQFLTEPEAEDPELLLQIAKGVHIYTNYTGLVQCNQISSTDSQDRLGTDSWDFQACTEMILPQCSNGLDDMFEPNPWNFTEYSLGCRKRWWQVDSEKFKALILFGGKNLKSTTNIIFSNGLRDPWSKGGVLESVSETVIAIKIPGACHHEDLRAQGPNDPKVLLDARAQELQIIRGWLEKYYQEMGIKFQFEN